VKTGSGSHPQAGPRVGYEATFSFKRSDFGMKFQIGPLSDDVHVTVALSCMPK
jgi:polyisoprenoid-binding protein YceI